MGGGENPDVAGVVEHNGGVVVGIVVVEKVIAHRQVRQQRLPPGFEEFFQRFGQQVPNQGGDGTVRQRGGSLGSSSRARMRSVPRLYCRCSSTPLAIRTTSLAARATAASALC